MESVTDFKKYNLDKSRAKIIQALENEPFGLQVSQIMSICQLSNKTVRNLLPTINAVESNGVWTLASTPDQRVRVKPVAPKPMVTPIPAPKAKPTQEVKSTSLGGDPQHKSKPREKAQKSQQIPLIDMEPSKTMEQNAVQPAPQKENTPSTQANVDPIFNMAVDECMAKVKTVITKAHELHLHQGDIDMLLSSLFGMDQIEWKYEDGAFSSIRLSKTETALP